MPTDHARSFVAVEDRFARITEQRKAQISAWPVGAIKPSDLKEWERLRDNGDMEKWLNVITDTRNPRVLATPSFEWMEALFRLSGATAALGHDTHPRAERIVTNIKKRFPPAIAAFKHPLACLSEYPAVGVRVLEILGNLAMMAMSDEVLLSSLKQYATPVIAFMTWLSLANSSLTAEEQKASTGGCVRNLSIVEIYGQVTMSQAVERIGPRTAAKLLDKYYQKTTVIDQQFSNISAVAMAMLGSDPGVSQQLFQQKTLSRVAQSAWKELAVKPVLSKEWTVTLWSSLSFIVQACLQQGQLQDPNGVAVVVDLVRTCDLFGLCALGLYFSAMRTPSPAAQRTSFDLPEFQAFTKGVTHACQTQPDVMKAHIRPYLLPFLDYIRDLDGPPLDRHGRSAVSKWLDSEIVQVVCGMSEAMVRMEARKAEMDQRRANTGGFIGCSWYQCIFHSGEADGAFTVAMFQDDNCQRVQYCSRYCQKRDWHDGKHKSVCRMSL